MASSHPRVAALILPSPAAVHFFPPRPPAGFLSPTPHPMLRISRGDVISTPVLFHLWLSPPISPSHVWFCGLFASVCRVDLIILPPWESKHAQERPLPPPARSVQKPPRVPTWLSLLAHLLICGDLSGLGSPVNCVVLQMVMQWPYLLVDPALTSVSPFRLVCFLLVLLYMYFISCV